MIEQYYANINTLVDNLNQKISSCNYTQQDIEFTKNQIEHYLTNIIYEYVMQILKRQQ